MENNTTTLGPVIEKLEEYVNSGFELLKLKAIDKSATVVSNAFSVGLNVALISVFVTVFNLGVAFWLGDLLGKVYLGFFCVTGFYGVLGLVYYLFLAKIIKRKTADATVSQLLD